MKFLTTTIIALALASLTTTALHAQINGWTGNGINGNISNVANWSNATLPTTLAQQGEINVGSGFLGAYKPIINANIANYFLNHVDGPITSTGNRVFTTCEWIMSGDASLAASAAMTFSGGSFTMSGNAQVTSTAALAATGTNFTTSGQASILLATTNFTLDGGTSVFNNSSSAAYHLTAGAITVGAGGTLDIKGDTRVEAKNYTISNSSGGGSILVTNNAKTDLKPTAGTYCITARGTSTLPGSITFAGQSETIITGSAGQGTTVADYGTLTIRDSAKLTGYGFVNEAATGGQFLMQGGTVSMSLYTAVHGKMTMSGGSFTTSGAINIGNVATGDKGTLILSGGTMTSTANAFSANFGTVTMSGGTLKTNTTFSSSNGTITMSGGLMQIGTNFTMGATGDSTGLLTITGGIIEVGSPGVGTFQNYSNNTTDKRSSIVFGLGDGKIVVLGSITTQANRALDFLSGSGGMLLAIPATYTETYWTSEWTNGRLLYNGQSYSQLGDPTFDTYFQVLPDTYDGRNYNALSLITIPEPTTWALLGMSLLVVTVLRRRKLS